MHQYNHFIPPQFHQDPKMINPVPMTPTFFPAQQHSILSTPIAVINPISNCVLYTDTQMNSVLRFVLLHDDYLPMIEAYTASKVTTIKELSTAREKFLAGYQPEQANILRRVVEGQVGLEEVQKSKIHDYEGAVKTLEKLNNSIREAVNNVELVGVAKSIGYEGSEQVLQVSVQFKNKINGVVTTVRTIGGSYTVPAFAPGYPVPRSYNPSPSVSQHSSVHQENSVQSFMQAGSSTHYVDALQKAYVSRPTTLKDVDLKSWVFCSVFGISIKADTPANKREEFILGVRSMLEDVLNNRLVNKLEAGHTYTGNVNAELFQASHIFRFDPHTLPRNSPEVDYIAQRFQENPTHCHWLKETINFDPCVPNATAALLRAVIHLLK